MRWQYIIYVVGALIFFLGLAMVVPLVCGLLYADQSVLPLIKSMVATIVDRGVPCS